ncbi:unnamed protein product [Bursaphelenchus okinawaensis]|uniref:Uncharacterized protein n=1 Tax=Bursaphelenchus okinawaensis TaxID=465554 RepID=A0A811L4A5_9BILA|nr:unnamed protein product [Bursaphelenchus okinawaensis]CAG9119271.1 unnamed protein product [Bursaphelenchus okinawaensis]
MLPIYNGKHLNRLKAVSVSTVRVKRTCYTFLNVLNNSKLWKIIALITIFLNYRLIQQIRYKDEKFVEITRKNSLVLSSREYEKEYCVIPDYWDPDVLSFPRSSITLVTHTAIEFIDYLDEHLKTWTGPISIAVIVPNPMHAYNLTGHDDYGTEEAVNYAFTYSLAKLDMLKAKQSKQITMNLIYKKEDKCHETLNVPLIRLVENKEFVTDRYNLIRRFAGYPANYLRNMARYGSKTNLIFQTDIENIPSEDFEQSLRPLANELLVSAQRKSLLIVPEFETTLGLDIPRNKPQLQQMYASGDVIESYTRRFHSANHRLPYIRQWMESNDSAIIPFKIIPYQGNMWEPAFVTYHRVLPFHPLLISDIHQDARFQVEETCRAGFDYIMVSNLFTVHPGFRLIADKIIDGARNDTMREMLTSYSNFKSNLDQRYPGTKDKCPDKSVERVL